MRKEFAVLRFGINFNFKTIRMLSATFIFFVVSLTNAINATTYHVAKTGNDRNNGTTSPFLSIQRGINALTAGDTLFVHAGVYQERIIVADRSGTADNPIVITAFPNERPVIDGNGLDMGGDGNGLVSIFSAYVRLNGFEIRNVDMNGMYRSNMAVYLNGNNVISNCIVHNANHGGIQICGNNNLMEYCTVYDCSMYNADLRIKDGNSAGVSIRGFPSRSVTANYNTIRNCTVYNVYGETVSAVYTQHTVMEDNVVYQGGIYVCNSQNGLYQRNFVYIQNDMGEFRHAAIGCDNEYSGNTNSDNTIVNNICYGAWSNFFSTSLINTTIANNTFVNSRYDWGVIIYRGFNHSNSRFVNNIVIQEGSAPCIFYDGSGGITFSNNLWNKTPVSNLEGGYSRGTGDIISTNSIIKSGSYTSTEYYKLFQGSPAINAGINVISSDFEKNQRSLSDIGAFEFNSGTVNPVSPLFVSSVIENSNPSRLEMTYNLSLAAIVPSASAFSVMVNSSSRSVTGVSVSGARVILTLSSPVSSGNTVTVAYTKPSVNPLQTSSGGQAATIGPQSVKNNILPVNRAPVVLISSPDECYSGFVGEISAAKSYDADKDKLNFLWSAPSSVQISSTSGEIIRFLGPVVSEPTRIEFTLRVSDGVTTTPAEIISVEILPFRPELEVAEVSGIFASSYSSHNYPFNVNDGRSETMWSSNGVNEWILIKLRQPFEVDHIKLAFNHSKRDVSFFDIYGSSDSITWELILNQSASCGFSGYLQTFNFPPSKQVKEFSYLKFVGYGSSEDSWNYVSEFKIFGYRNKRLHVFENQPVRIYPNPAWEKVNIRIVDESILPDCIVISDLSGSVYLIEDVDPMVREFDLPLSLKGGLYILKLGSGGLTLFAQKLIIRQR